MTESNSIKRGGSSAGGGGSSSASGDYVDLGDLMSPSMGHYCPKQNQASRRAGRGITARLLGSLGFLELLKKDVYSFEATHTSSTRVQVSSQSIDRIWAVQRASGFDSQKAPVQVTGGPTSINSTLTRHFLADSYSILLDESRLGLDWA